MRRYSKVIIMLFCFSLIFNGIVNIYAQDNNPHGKDFNIECEKCHSTDTWKVNLSKISFDHSKTGFPLNGQHSILLCSDCHSTLKFKDASTDCFSCHVDAHKNTLGLDCIKCHNTNSWKQVNIQPLHDQFRFPLTGVHKSEDCELCHVNSKNFIFTGTSIKCFDCHGNDFNRAANPIHTVMGLSKNCEDCHTLQSTNWKAEKFKHVQLSFTGAHVNLSCNQCHNNTHLGYTQDCYGCHKNDFDKTANPPHLSGKYPHDCSVCHNTSSWVGAQFNHDQTGFPLTGSHKNVDCSTCHQSGYTGTSPLCFNCHVNSFNAAPKHLAQGYPHTCEMCHNTVTWNQVNFDHNGTAFQLTGSHINVDCNSCHTSGFAGTPTQCFSCHQSSFNSALNHVSQGYPHNCEMCHTTVAWNQTSFDHNTTGFILTGSHINVNCSSCHINGFTGTSNQCFSCHESVYNSAPDHLQKAYPHSCEMCHNTTKWDQTSFDHNTTGFQLTGSHINVNCSQCHSNGYSGTSKDCFSCHQSKYNTADKHLSLNYPHSCEMCHNTISWSQVNFDHNTTSFQLTGAHISTNCNSCHTTTLAGTPKECYSCHISVYNTALNHVSQGYPHNCEMCHSTTVWNQTSFNHNSTGFQLTGSHINVSCNLCHANGFTGTPNQCFACHESAFNQAPDHLQKGYPHACETCHNTTVWNQVTFDHNSTAFALTGAHINVNCSDCHSSGFPGTPKLCQNCHTTDYNNTTNPSHKNLNLPVTCEQCHSTNPGWKPAQFPNHADYFAFAGAHVSIKDNCTSCHNGNYNNTPNTCYGCHQTDYNNTTDPPHSSIGFPQTCTDCHSQAAWKQANFDHDGRYFPIYSGSHNGRWSKCSDCHTNSSNYQVFSCINCHEHNKTETDSHHSDVSGYSYNSLECYRCHPQGRSEGVSKFLPRTKINAK